MATDPPVQGLNKAITRREMLKGTSAAFITVMGGSILAACADGTASTTTLAAATSSTGAAATSTTAGILQVTQLMSTPGPSFANAQSAVAMEMGFYADEGIDPTFEYPGTSVRSLQTLVGGTGTLALADSFAVLVGAAEELDLKSIYLTSRGYVFGMAVAADSPIQEWNEDTVAGTTIGITEFAGGEVPVLRGALARMGMTEGEDVEFVAIGTGGPETADAIQSGSVDIVAASVVDFEVFKATGVDLRVITPDYIRAFPGQSLVTTPELLDANRDALAKTLRATSKSTVFINANPMAAAEIAVAAAPASAEGIPVELVAVLLQTLIADGNAYAFEEGNPDYHRLGTHDAAAYNDFQLFLIETGTEGDDGTTLTQEVDVEAIIDDSLIDEANDFDYAEIEALAQNQ